MIDATHEPSRRDLLVFAGLWLVFWIAMGAILPRAGGAILAASIFLAGTWVVSMAFNRETSLRQQLAGAAPPGVLLLLWSLAGWLPSTAQAVALVAFSGLGVAGSLAILASAGLGRRIHRAWTQAFAPTAWSVSLLLLAIVFFGVLTPTSLLMRLVGRDPLSLRVDRSSKSYWTERRPSNDPRRYFQQS